MTFHCPSSNGRQVICQGLTVVLSLAFVSVAMAQADDPLNMDQAVPRLQYQSPLTDFRAFKPDQQLQSWVEANRRVDQLGGWRAYLKRAAKPGTAIPANQTKPAGQGLRIVPVRQKPISTGLPKAVPDAKPTSTPPVPAAKQSRLRPTPRQHVRVAVKVPLNLGDCPRRITRLKLPYENQSDPLTEIARNRLIALVPCLQRRDYVVGGNTDSRGASAENKQVSEQIARAMVDFLVDAGVPASRLVARGYGEDDPVATNKSANGRALNRRIDFRFAVDVN